MYDRQLGAEVERTGCAGSEASMRPGGTLQRRVERDLLEGCQARAQPTCGAARTARTLPASTLHPSERIDCPEQRPCRVLLRPRNGLISVHGANEPAEPGV